MPAEGSVRAAAPPLAPSEVAKAGWRNAELVQLGRSLRVDADSPLGNLGIKASLDGRIVHLSLSAADPEARGVLRSAVDGLRSDLTAAGFDLGKFDVQSDSADERPAPEHSSRREPQLSAGAVPSTSYHPATTRTGALDVHA